MRRVAALTLAGLMLSGCAHEVVLTPQDGIGPIGRGSAPATMVAYHGEMVVDLAGKHYAGEWTLQSDGGYVGSGIGVAGGQVATATVYGASTSGNGRAYMTEPGGGSVSCGFSFNSMSYSGIGECRTEAGKIYNMVIH
jgi:hypothetical protein